MIYTELTKKALTLCFEAHKSQIDKGGSPYVFHPYHLAEQMQDETTTIVALLHDVVEDGGVGIDKLRKAGFPEEALDALSLLTHRKCVPYKVYIAALRDNLVARTVKIADLRHNSDLSRLQNVTPDDLQRVRKYQRALAFLEDGSWDGSSATV